jgi:hypothetical protein
MLEQADLTVVADHLSDMLVVKLQTYVLTEHLADHTQARTTLVPAGWLDHLKRDHPDAARRWSRWVWRLAPPTMRPIVLTVTWTDRAAYPQATLRLPPNPKLGPVVLWRTATSHLEADR